MEFGLSQFSGVNCDGELAHYLSYPQVQRFVTVIRRDLEKVGPSIPTPSPASTGSRSASDFKVGYYYKKREPRNSLKLLDAKRQILTVERHDQTIERQKSLAHLSLVCHRADDAVTKTESENVRGEPNQVGDDEPSQHEAGLSRLSHKSERSVGQWNTDAQQAIPRSGRQGCDDRR